MKLYMRDGDVAEKVEAMFKLAKRYQEKHLFVFEVDSLLKDRVCEAVRFWYLPRVVEFVKRRKCVDDALELKQTRDRNMWYFAYGSNMDSSRFQSRVGITGHPQQFRAFLSNYKFAFNKQLNSGTAAANVYPNQDSVVYGVAYPAASSHLNTLDKFEGVRSRHYRRETMNITLYFGKEQKVVSAAVYTAYPEVINNHLAPTDEYFGFLMKGSHLLPPEYITEIEQARDKNRTINK